MRFFSPLGYDGPWTPTPTTFNNAYYTLLMNLKWVPKEWDGPFQYVDASTGKLMMLPSYVHPYYYSFSPFFLCMDPHLTHNCVCRFQGFGAVARQEIYEICQSLRQGRRQVHRKYPRQAHVATRRCYSFSPIFATTTNPKRDFTTAFQKLEELGTTGLTPTEWA